MLTVCFGILISSQKAFSYILSKFLCICSCTYQFEKDSFFVWSFEPKWRSADAHRQFYLTCNKSNGFQKVRFKQSVSTNVNALWEHVSALLCAETSFEEERKWVKQRRSVLQRTLGTDSSGLWTALPSWSWGNVETRSCFMGSQFTHLSTCCSPAVTKPLISLPPFVEFCSPSANSLMF